VRELADSLLVKTSVLFIRGYQVFLSPLLVSLTGPGMGCRFQPSCSRYAIEALRTTLQARSFLALRRFACHPRAAVVMILSPSEGCATTGPPHLTRTY
jgi:putative component of membrane protein insertase Oxa1/YidC/SpoIIIJ protein YidD